jgi:hypothetical protein
VGTLKKKSDHINLDRKTNISLALGINAGTNALSPFVTQMAAEKDARDWPPSYLRHTFLLLQIFVPCTQIILQTTAVEILDLEDVKEFVSVTAHTEQSSDLDLLPV